jgi:hypothetical protein
MNGHSPILIVIFALCLAAVAIAVWRMPRR